METITINLRIAERDYPMRVNAAEEERIRKAGKLINESLNHYKEKLRINDKQDLLAMVAFDCLMGKLRQEEETGAQRAHLQEKLQGLDQLLDRLL